MTECLGFEMPLGYHPYDSYRLIASFVQLETTVYDTCISLFYFLPLPPVCPLTISGFLRFYLAALS